MGGLTRRSIHLRGEVVSRDLVFSLRQIESLAYKASTGPQILECQVFCSREAAVYTILSVL